MDQILIVSSKLLDVTHLSSFLDCQVASDSLIYSFVIQEGRMHMMFTSTGGWNCVEFVDVDDEVTNLVSKVRAFPYRPCNCKAGLHRWVLDVRVEPVALV